MKLEIARGLFFVSALGVASLAAAAWHEPGPQVLTSDPEHCPLPRGQAAKVVQPDGDLLLLLFGLSQGLRGQS
ncbi:hypothetical protein NVV93_04370 [Pseudomonas sp. LS44]|uniref:hypothetical protein n=1 Tax=Pseudomonas sp. LS44 TaxID=1357074 RepID=UPI00215AEF95|nr:hypothetical protein [Pseudomonas sp. LS44]UVE18635.1 hypothetical protein NVV93_04370 [Pseudomonas sp. LS44]